MDTSLSAEDLAFQTEVRQFLNRGLGQGTGGKVQ